MGLRLGQRSGHPQEIVVEFIPEGTVTPWEFRVYYADGTYDLGSHRTRDGLVGALSGWLEAEGFDSQAIMRDMPGGGRREWSWSIKLKYA